MIGRRMLEIQLRRIGAFAAEEKISSHPNFDDSFKICELSTFIFSTCSLRIFIKFTRSLASLCLPATINTIL